MNCDTFDVDHVADAGFAVVVVHVGFGVFADPSMVAVSLIVVRNCCCWSRIWVTEPPYSEMPDLADKHNSARPVVCANSPVPPYDQPAPA